MYTKGFKCGHAQNNETTAISIGISRTINPTGKFSVCNAQNHQRSKNKFWTCTKQSTVLSPKHKDTTIS